MWVRRVRKVSVEFDDSVDAKTKHFLFWKEAIGGEWKELMVVDVGRGR
jgi:hypothetical protein